MSNGKYGVLVAATLMVAIALRICHFAANTALWGDEAMLVLALQDWSLATFTTPLSYKQQGYRT